MIKRSLENRLIDAINNMPVVALLGPRQVGKTTLALEVAKLIGKESGVCQGSCPFYSCCFQ